MFTDNARTVDALYEWTPDKMLEVSLANPDDFLKVRETLTRMGIASKKQQVLYQSCHLLHKKGRYYVVHFKEMFALDGRDSDLTISDVERRNLIAGLLSEWGLLKIVDENRASIRAPMSAIRIIPYKEKSNWELKSKYQIGTKTR